jgi:phosphatidylglycerol---prolipoprotein diacylglyceryl transferase
MLPRLPLGNTQVDAYALFFVLGWLVGGGIFYLEVKRRGWPLEKLLFAMVGCVVGAVVGAVISGMLFFDWREVLTRLVTFQLGGKSVVGGIAGGFLGVEIAKKLVGYPHSTGDAFALAIPIGHAIGRVGCLLGGCCFGAPTRLPWAIRYPAGAPAHATEAALGQIDVHAVTSLPVHPTPLYEVMFDLCLFAVLFAMRDRLRVRGNLFRVYLLAYAAFRFALEFVRADSPFPAIGGPKPVQWLLALAACRYAYLLWKQEIAVSRDASRASHPA